MHRARDRQHDRHGHLPAAGVACALWLQRADRVGDHDFRHRAAGAHLREPRASHGAGRWAVRIRAGDAGRRRSISCDVVLLGVGLGDERRACGRRGRLPDGGPAGARSPAARSRRGRPDMAVRYREPAGRAHRRRCADRHDVPQAHPDGSHHRARDLDTARGSERLHAEPADDAGYDAVDSCSLGDRAVRNARHRIRRDSGGPGSPPGAHDPARYDRGYRDHGTGVHRGDGDCAFHRAPGDAWLARARPSSKSSTG